MKKHIVDLGGGKYRFEGEADLAEYKDIDFEYYMFVISFPACPEGITISDVKMMQTVSGKINLDFDY